MKKQIYAIALILILISASMVAGCSPLVIKKSGVNEDPGPEVTRQYDYSDFDRIEASFAFEIDVTPSETYSVAITTGDNIFEHIDVSKNGNTLKIKLSLLNISPGFPRMKAKITMPALRGFELSGATKTSAKGFRSSDDINILISGASRLDLDMETGNFETDISGASIITGLLNASSCDIELSGASRLDLEGNSGNIKLDASGASQVNLKEFRVQDIDISLNGASRASIYVNGKMDVDLNGLSSLEYEGNPVLGDVNVSGLSELKRR